MKLLLDQNISFRVVKKIAAEFPEAEQVRALGLEDATDLEIYDFAKLNGFTIVTFDRDFQDLTQLKGYPPKIIWLRTGNTSTEEIAQLLLSWKEVIEAFIEDEESKEVAYLEIG